MPKMTQPKPRWLKYMTIEIYSLMHAGTLTPLDGRRRSDKLVELMGALASANALDVITAEQYGMFYDLLHSKKVLDYPQIAALLLDFWPEFEYVPEKGKPEFQKRR